MHDLEKWVLSSTQSTHFLAQYHLVLSNSQLWQPAVLRPIANAHLGLPAIYFWVLEHHGQKHRIYVGKTKSLGYRILNYASAFQPHSPNDFKLQVFHKFSQEHYADSKLSMHYTPSRVDELTAQENKEIAFFDPLLNSRLRPSGQTRRHLEQAFVAYYRSGFEEILRGD